MAFYLWQVGYTSDAWATQVKNPQNRLELVRPVAEKLGGRIIDAWFAFGEYDVVVIVEMPDNVSMASLVLAASTGGHLSATKTTPLMPIEDGLAAMQRAEEITYPKPE